MEKISTEVAKLEKINSGSEIVPYVVPKAVEEDHEQEKVQLHDKLFNSLKRLVVQMVSTLKSKDVDQATQKTTDNIVEALPVSFIVPENCDVDPQKLDMAISQEKVQKKGRMATIPAGEILVSFKFPDDIDINNINIDKLQMPRDKIIGYNVGETHKFSVSERLTGWRVERRNRNKNDVVKYDLYYHHQSSKTSFRSTNEVVNFLLYEAYPKAPNKRKADANCSTPEGGMRRPRKKQKTTSNSDPNPIINLNGDDPFPIINVSDEGKEKCLSEKPQENHLTPTDPKFTVKSPKDGIDFLAEYVLKDDEIKRKMMELNLKEKFLKEKERKLKKKEDKLNQIAAATKRNNQIFNAAAAPNIMPQNCGSGSTNRYYTPSPVINFPKDYIASVEQFLATSRNNMESDSYQTSGLSSRFYGMPTILEEKNDDEYGRTNSTAHRHPAPTSFVQVKANNPMTITDQGGRATTMITIKRKIPQNKKNDQSGKGGKRDLPSKERKEKLTAGVDQSNNVMEDREKLNPKSNLEAKNYKGKSKVENCEANYSRVVLEVEANIHKEEQTIHNNNNKNKEKATEISSIWLDFAQGVEHDKMNEIEHVKKEEDDAIENSSIKANCPSTGVVLEAQESGHVVLENNTIGNVARVSIMPYIDSIETDQTNLVNCGAGNSNSMVTDLKMKDNDEFDDLFENILESDIIDLSLD